MKRIFLLAIQVLVLLSALAFAAPTNNLKTLSMNVSATNGGYHRLEIEVLNNGGVYVGQAEGMPFDLLGEDVAYVDTNTTAGRVIGHWTLNSNNTPVTVSVQASNLYRTDNAGNPVEDAPVLGYVLFFPFVYSVDLTGKNDVEGFMRVESGSVYSSTTDSYCYIEGTTTNPISAEVEAINIENMPIRFMMKNDEQAKIQSDDDGSDYPDGLYKADVRVEVTGRG